MSINTNKSAKEKLQRIHRLVCEINLTLQVLYPSLPRFSLTIILHDMLLQLIVHLQSLHISPRSILHNHRHAENQSLAHAVRVSVAAHSQRHRLTLHLTHAWRSHLRSLEKPARDNNTRSSHRQSAAHTTTKLHQNPSATLHQLHVLLLPELVVGDQIAKRLSADGGTRCVCIHGAAVVSPRNDSLNIAELQRRVVCMRKRVNNYIAHGRCEGRSNEHGCGPSCSARRSSCGKSTEPKPSERT